MTSGLLDPSSTLGRVGKSCPAARLVKLADCVDLLSGFAFKSQEFTNDPHDVALVKGENVSQGRVLWDISKRWPLEDWRKYEKFQLAAGDVVIAMDRPWVPAGLKWCFIRDHDPQALLVQRCCRLRVNPRLMDQTFLRCVIGGPGFESYIKPITTGVNIPHISGRQILDYSFPLPDLPTQRKIAGILSAYDDLIENNLRRIKILEQMAQSLYREWFVHFRFPGHESAEFVDSPLGQIPKGWEWRKVGDAFEIQGGGTPSTANEEYWVDGDIQWYSPRDLTAESTMFIEKSATQINELGLKKSSAKMFPAYSAMLTSRATIGAIAINTVPSCTNQGFITCLPNAKVPLYFLHQWLMANVETFILHASGSTFKEISKGVFKGLDFLQPDAGLVQRYQRAVAPLADQLLNLQRRNQNLRQTRDLLLPKLLSGS